MNPYRLLAEVVAVFAIACALFGAGVVVGTKHEHALRAADVAGLKAEMVTLRADAATALAAAESDYRQREQTIVQEQGSKLHDATLQADALRADRDRAVRTGGGLQQRFAALAASCTAGARPAAATAASGPTASSPGDLLTYMQRRLGEAEDRTIEFADSAGAASELCAADYEIARRAISRAAPASLPSSGPH